jgi:NADPH:quinone reductase-like Zn-dependent oxidoreductase
MTCSGANVAINTLTSSGFVACSLASLSRGGTFVEISKRDIWCMERVLQERSDISYNLLAVDFMSAEALHSALMRVSEGVTHNRLRPLPLISHNMASIVDALRQMSQARHIGKIVVMPQVSVDPAIADGSALITGGTGTFGLQ